MKPVFRVSFVPPVIIVAVITLCPFVSLGGYRPVPASVGSLQPAASEVYDGTSGAAMAMPPGFSIQLYCSVIQEVFSAVINSPCFSGYPSAS